MTGKTPEQVVIRGPTPAQTFDLARSDLAAAAVDVLARGLAGQLDSIKAQGRDAELQIKCAQIVLGMDPGKLLRSMSLAALEAHAAAVLAEIERRKAAKKP